MCLDKTLNQMPFQLLDIPRWFLINMFLRYGFTRSPGAGALVWFSCIQQWKWMVHRTITAMSCCSNSCCWWLLLSSAPCVHKSTELLWHKTPDFTPDMRPPNRPDLNPVDYEIWTVIQECIYQKQAQHVLSYITDKLWLLTEWHVIFHKVG